MHSTEEILGWRGRDVIDRDGDKVGSLEEIYLDAETDEPAWAAVKTGMFGKRGTFVPIQGAELEGGSVRVAYDKGQIKDAPNIDPDGELSPSEEDRLFEHYGLGGGGASDRDSALDEGRDRVDESRDLDLDRDRPVPLDLESDQSDQADHRDESDRGNESIGAPASGAAVRRGDDSTHDLDRSRGDDSATGGGAGTAETATSGGADTTESASTTRRPRIRRHITEEVGADGQVERRETRTEETFD